jgi:hypothetical protein
MTIRERIYPPVPHVKDAVTWCSDCLAGPLEDCRPGCRCRSCELRKAYAEVDALRKVPK